MRLQRTRSGLGCGIRDGEPERKEAMDLSY